jgi:predicted nucleic acid-binding protein
LAVEPLGRVLRRHRRIALDTSIFVYQLEANPRYLPLTDAVFLWLEQPGHSGVTSTITMTELLVPAYRNGDERQVDEFYGLLTTFPNLGWIPPDLTIADVAAQLRAAHRLRTPDALQAATALRESATAIVTNDAVFQRVEEFDSILLDRFL